MADLRDVMDAAANLYTALSGKAGGGGFIETRNGSALKIGLMGGPDETRNLLHRALYSEFGEDVLLFAPNKEAGISIKFFEDQNHLRRLQELTGELGRFRPKEVLQAVGEIVRRAGGYNIVGTLGNFSDGERPVLGVGIGSETSPDALEKAAKLIEKQFGSGVVRFYRKKAPSGDPVKDIISEIQPSHMLVVNLAFFSNPSKISYLQDLAAKIQTGDLGRGIADN